MSDTREVVYVCPRLEDETGDVVLCIPEPADVDRMYCTAWSRVGQHGAASWSYFDNHTSIATYQEAIGVIEEYVHYYGVEVRIIPDLETAFERFLQVIEG